MDINSDIHWQVRLYDFMLGNESVAVSVDNIIFDTGSSLNYLPEREFKAFFAKIQQTKKCYFDPLEDLVFCDCNGVDDEFFPQLAIHIGSSKVKHWFYLTNRDYLKYSARHNKCGLLIKQEPQDTK